jgi:spermidine synthase
MEVLVFKVLSRVRRALRSGTAASLPPQPNVASRPEDPSRVERSEFVRHFESGVEAAAGVTVSTRALGAAVLLASALGLYLEMVMVRWHSSCMHTFGVFKNVSMLSCFLGLGIGYAIAGQKRPIRLSIVLPLLALQCVTFAIISRTRLGRLSLNPIAEHYVMWQSDWRWWVEGLGGNLALAITFVVNACMFIPLGHAAGHLMGGLPKLQGYAINLIGSLTGIAVFVLLSALWTPPIIWMGVAVFALLALGAAVRMQESPSERRVVFWPTGLVSLACMFVAFGIVDRPGVQHLYSPYQTITCQLGPDSKYPCVAKLMVNQASFQRVLNLSPASQEGNDALQRIAQYYDLPHQLMPDARRVLVVGAGTGNDVAAALRASAESVTAVEIDPTILFLGERLHPEAPYADSRVRLVNDDARTFIRHTGDRFDMIVYGLLDSHTLLGSMTNVRLDSFVYTVEAFREAAARLSDDGLLAVTFAVMTPQQGKKLYEMLRQAFDGVGPRCFEVGYDGGVMMLAGPALRNLESQVPGAKEISQRFSDPRLSAEVSTDDWPFFYMPHRTYPVTYVAMIVVLLSLSVALLYRHVGLPRSATDFFNPFFFLGAGFMLIETKAVTQLGLVLGNNWQVLAVVVTAILLVAFLANAWILWRGPVGRTPAFALLVGSLIAGHLVASAISSGWNAPFPGLLLTVALTMPLFFSGLIFSSELAHATDLASVLSSNLFGAMLGGFLEYNAMYWGYSSLTWMGLAIYAAAYAASRFLPSRSIRLATAG